MFADNLEYMHHIMSHNYTNFVANLSGLGCCTMKQGASMGIPIFGFLKKRQPNVPIQLLLFYSPNGFYKFRLYSRLDNHFHSIMCVYVNDVTRNSSY